MADDAMNSINLSDNCALYYVLRESGVGGHVTSGRAELHEPEGVVVFDVYGRRNEYISGERLRSWSVIRGGVLVPGWSHIAPEDTLRFSSQ